MNTEAWRGNSSTVERLSLPLLTAGLVSVAVFLPWSTYLTNASISIAALIWLFFVRVHKTFFTKEIIFFIILFGSLYFIEVVGMLYTDNVSYGLFRLETKLSLLVFPLITLASGIQKKSIQLILVVFICSTILACTWCTITAVKSIHDQGLPFSILINDFRYSNLNLTAPIKNIHPTYLSLFICLTIYFIADYIRKHRSAYLLILIIFYLILFTFQLASRAGLAALFCTLVIIGVSFIGRRQKLFLVLYFTFIIAAVITITLAVPIIKYRMVDTVMEASIQEEQVNSVSYHYKSWYCAIEKLSDNHIIFGYGTGDEINTISECYAENGWIDYRHDAHNEYLSSLLKHGLIGLAILLACLIYPYYLAFKNKDLFYISFLTTIIICFFSESMLRGQTGLVFYTLFNSLLLKGMLKSTA